MTFLGYITSHTDPIDTATLRDRALPVLTLRLCYRALEPRMVFDAALIATATTAADHAADAAVDPHHIVADPVDTHAGLIDALQSIPADTRGETVVFVDQRVANYQAIVANAAPGAQIVLLNSNSGGLEQIAAYLQSHHNVDSIHILSHGGEAQLQLGSDLLTDANLSDHQAALAEIGHALRAGGDIIIYGCDVAAGADGAHFVSSIAALTGDDVASSTNLTGAFGRGGDWILEKQIGHIETLTIHAEDWAGTLATFSINAATAPVVVTGSHVGGPITGDKATYANVGTTVVGGVTYNVNLVGTIVNSTVGDTIGWGISAGAASLTMGGGADGGQVQIHWELIVQSPVPQPLVADIKIAITDIDGTSPTVKIESVAASQTGLVSYSVANPTNLIVTSAGGFIRADGTANESGGPTSIIQYSFASTSNWDITYFTAPGASGRQFNNSGDSTYVIPGAVTIGGLLDLDANDSTTTGFNYQKTFVENGAGVQVVDTR